MFLPGYAHFLRTAAAFQWDEGAIDLGPDGVAWPRLALGDRERVLTLLAGFCVGEHRVAEDLGPFERAAEDPQAAECFRLQAVDEARHARFFDRVAAEVARVPGTTAEERRQHLRPRLDPTFLDLFERDLRGAAAELAEDTAELGGGVALYHMVLEGIVFTAGQLALLAVLEEEDALPGLRHGLELVLRDERWHIGFGARLLELVGTPADFGSRVIDAADPALDAWGTAVPAGVRREVLHIHRRRLRATRLLPREMAA